MLYFNISWNVRLLKNIRDSKLGNCKSLSKCIKQKFKIIYADSILKENQRTYNENIQKTNMYYSINDKGKFMIYKTSILKQKSCEMKPFQ